MQNIRNNLYSQRLKNEEGLGELASKFIFVFIEDYAFEGCILFLAHQIKISWSPIKPWNYRAYWSIKLINTKIMSFSTVMFSCRLQIDINICVWLYVCVGWMHVCAHVYEE